MCLHRMWRHLPFLPPSLLSQSMSRRLAMIAPSLLLWQIHIESITIYIYIYIYIYRYLCHVQAIIYRCIKAFKCPYIYNICVSVCIHIYIYISPVSCTGLYTGSIWRVVLYSHTLDLIFFFVLLSSAQSCPRALPHINSSGKVERHRWSHLKVSVEQARTIRWWG